jgi:hypothetical protein
MLAQKPDNGDKSEMRQQATGYDDGIVTEADNIAKAQKSGQSIYLQNHSGFISQPVHKGNKPESYNFIPQPDPDGQEFIQTGHYHAQNQRLSLVFTTLARDQNLSRSGSFREGQFPVLFDTEITPERNEE